MNKNASTTLNPEWWKDALLNAWEKMTAFIPNILGMLLILILGFIVSKLIQRIVTLLLKKMKLDRMSENSGIKASLDKVGVRLSAAEIIGRLVFWIFMLTFIISATETLGLDQVSQTINALVNYIPNIIAAGFVAIVGLLITNMVTSVVKAGGASMGIDYSKQLSKVIHMIMIVIVFTLAVGQLGIETSLINRIIEIGLMAFGAGLAIGLGFGSVDVAKNMLAGLYVRENLSPNAAVTIADASGKLTSVGAVTATLVDDKGKLIHIPNVDLLNQKSTQEPVETEEEKNDE